MTKPKENVSEILVQAREVAFSVTTSETRQINQINAGNQRPAGTRFGSVFEWQEAGVPVELVSVQDAPKGLLRYERETCVNFVETDSVADVMTCDIAWIRRLERMGANPNRIVAFEHGNGQMRHYRIPRRWVRRPYPSQPQRGRYLSAPEWMSEGVRINHTTREIPKSERETSLLINEAEPLMEINTCNRNWHKRLEMDGACPERIEVHEGAAAEFRLYFVSRTWMKLPAASGRR